MPDRLRAKAQEGASDHDLLIQLIEVTKAMSDKFMDLKTTNDSKLQEIKHTQELTIAKMDARIVTLETLVIKNNVEERIGEWNHASNTIRDLEKDGKFKNWDDAHEWSRDIRKSWKLLLTVIGVVAGAVSWLVQVLLPTLKGGS